MNSQVLEYRVLSNLGSGSGHQVMKVQHNSTAQILAMKIEKSPQLGQLESEVSILKQLKSIDGVPQLLDYGKTKDFRCYLITPILKRNLQEILKDNTMSINQILTIGLSILKILEQVHKKHILHLDIKPENIMISSSHIKVSLEEIAQPGFVQLIDFGLSQKVGQINSQNKVFVGSIRYASRQAHKGNQLYYKDDLESLLYVLVYLRNKNLPWQTTQKYQSQQMEIRKIGEVKDAVFNTMDLTQRFPQQFTAFKTYIDGLAKAEMPNYDYLKSLFRQMLSQEKYSPAQQHTASILTQSNSYKESNKIQISDQMIQLFQHLQKQDQLLNEEDLSDTETSIVLISDLVKTFNTQTPKSIVDIKF
ncbi:unnamed protein product [Paramecium primaurelia]|uniref:Casein kinase I n=1 Tax=Paramecium primaurelia TaxID=5886 RepID=A0A8S1N1V4_PARPR|nr:unnamed protein product [Paramecium primaurelia]